MNFNHDANVVFKKQMYGETTFKENAGKFYAAGLVLHCSYCRWGKQDALQTN